MTDPGTRVMAAIGGTVAIASTLAPKRFLRLFAQAVKEDVVTILRGNLKLLERFAELFRIDASLRANRC